MRRIEPFWLNAYHPRNTAQYDIMKGKEGKTVPQTILRETLLVSKTKKLTWNNEGEKSQPSLKKAASLSKKKLVIKLCTICLVRTHEVTNSNKLIWSERRGD